jgi:Flp pilus assembly protein CpaB
MPTPRPTLPRSAGLPSSRAAAGGLLVAVSVGLSLHAGASEESAPTTRYLVASEDLPVGHELSGEEVGVVALDLPTDVASHAIGADTDLAGAVTLGPVRRGQLLASSDVLRADPTAGTSTLELSLPVATERALDGRLVPGEVVDVLSTAGTGVEAATERVAAAVRVLAVSAPDDSLARAGIIVVTLAVADDETARALAHAGATAEISIVRGVTR